MKTIEDLDFSGRPDKPTVQLRAAPLPYVLRHFAVHLYLVGSDGSSDWERWEVWQRKDRMRQVCFRLPGKEQIAFGHVHLNLKQPLEGVGGGSSFAVHTWEGEEAERIIGHFRTFSQNYVSRNRYMPWPGPNSNTYISRLLKSAGVDRSLPGTAIGKDWNGLFHFRMNLRKRLRFIMETPVLGVRLSRKDDFEFHLLGMTLGFNFRFREVKYPVGRGFRKIKRKAG